MKQIIVLVLVVAVAAIPATSHAFGLCRYIWDGVANQLGLDRGPIPKVGPRPCRGPVATPWDRLPPHAYLPVVYLQAEGF